MFVAAHIPDSVIKEAFKSISQKILFNKKFFPNCNFYSILLLEVVVLAAAYYYYYYYYYLFSGDIMYRECSRRSQKQPLGSGHQLHTQFCLSK